MSYAFEAGNLKKVFGYLIAVMDGTAGSLAAQHCANRIPVVFQPTLDEGPEAPVKELIRRLHEETAAMDAVTTISVAAIYESHGFAVVGVLGDSPVITVDAHGSVCIGPEHNVRTNDAEREAAIARGGLVTRDGYLMGPDRDRGLQMSRALGGNWMGDVVSREPETYTVQLGTESAVIVASDGLLDPIHGKSEELAEETMAMVRRGLVATDLVLWAQERGLYDNATALVWRARR